MKNNKPGRSRYRSHDRSYGDRGYSGRNYRRNSTNNHSFGNVKSISNDQYRPNFLKGNQNASRLLEKYTNLAKEALSSGDIILSENYFQHADHFSRIVSERNTFKNSKIENNAISVNDPTKTDSVKSDKEEDIKKEDSSGTNSKT